MARVLLFQLDGKLPNIALMRIAAHYDGAVELRQVRTSDEIQPELWGEPDRVYGSAIFEKTYSLAEHLLEVYPWAIVGGTGWNLMRTLEDVGIHTTKQDYSIYPDYPHSIGFTQRGCRFKCPFCVVPRKEGKVTEEQTVYGIWRGEPHSRTLVLLDNDFFGQPNWRDRIAEIRDGGFKVSLVQGINARTLDDEQAAALASIPYYSQNFRKRRIYTAWDNRKDERRLFEGFEALARHGVKPGHLMVYMLVEYWPNETFEDWEYRRSRLRAFGADPYPIPYVRTPKAVGFQRWVVGAHDKRVPWAAWEQAEYRPEKVAE